MLDRATALKVVSEISKISKEVTIDGITLSRIDSSNEYIIVLKMLSSFPKDLIQPILNKYSLVIRKESNFVFIHPL